MDYKDSKDLDRLSLDTLELITDQADAVSFTVTGASAETCATAIAAIIASLQAAGIMAE